MLKYYKKSCNNVDLGLVLRSCLIMYWLLRPIYSWLCILKWNIVCKMILIRKMDNCVWFLPSTGYCGHCCCHVSIWLLSWQPSSSSSSWEWEPGCRWRGRARELRTAVLPWPSSTRTAMQEEEERECCGVLYVLFKTGQIFQLLRACHLFGQTFMGQWQIGSESMQKI